MTLDKARKIVAEYQLWRRGLPPYDYKDDSLSMVDFPYIPKELGEAIDTLLAATTVTDEKVERSLNAVVGEGETVFWSIVFGLQNDTDEIRKIMAGEIIRAALQAALVGGE